MAILLWIPRLANEDKTRLEVPKGEGVANYYDSSRDVRHWSWNRPELVGHLVSCAGEDCKGKRFGEAAMMRRWMGDGAIRGVVNR